MPKRTRRTKAPARKKFRKALSSRPNKNFNALHLIQNHGPTLMRFARSFICRQPMPDRYRCWLYISNDGYFGSGAATGNFGWCLNWPLLPLNNPGSITNALPNAAIAVNGLNPCGLKNLLYNGSTNTGIWQSMRVLRHRCEIVATPQTSGDNTNFAIAAVTGANFYTAYNLVAQGPNSQSTMGVLGVASRECTCAQDWSMPAIAGKTLQQYESDPSYSGTTAAAPTNQIFGNMYFLTADRQNLSGTLPVKVLLAYYVEFFNRVDTALLDS